MLRIQFNNPKTMQTADFIMVYDSVIQLNGVAIIFDDFLRWWLFGEPFPHYVWFKGKN